MENCTAEWSKREHKDKLAKPNNKVVFSPKDHAMITVTLMKMAKKLLRGSTSIDLRKAYDSVLLQNCSIAMEQTGID